MNTSYNTLFEGTYKDQMQIDASHVLYDIVLYIPVVSQSCKRPPRAKIAGGFFAQSNPPQKSHRALVVEKTHGVRALCLSLSRDDPIGSWSY